MSWSPDKRSKFVTTEPWHFIDVAKHSPGGHGHDQMRHGGKGGARLARDVGTQGGFTYRPSDRREPKQGFAVSPYSDREGVYHVLEFNRGTVDAYKRKNADLLRKPDHFLGGWRDGDRIYLDISVVKPSREAAVRLAKRHKQLAIFDLGSGETIDTR